MLSLILMGVATVLIGLLPTYAQIGIWAPIALIALRLVQGFAVGGEWGGAVLMAAEHGDAARRGFWASWPQAGVPAGNLLAAGVLALMAGVQTEEDFLAWGWRVPFVLSAGVGGGGRDNPQPAGGGPEVPPPPRPSQDPPKAPGGRGFSGGAGGRPVVG